MICVLIRYQYRQISSNGFVVETTKSISVGGELLAYYNSDYFDGTCPCHSHTSSDQAQLTQVAVHDEAARMLAKKVNRLRKKEELKERTVMGTLTDEEKGKKARNNLAKKKRKRVHT